MAGVVRGRRRTAGPLAAAAVLGVLLGSAAFAVAPLPLHGPGPSAGADGPAPSSPSSPSAPGSPSVSRSPSAGATSATPSPVRATPTEHPSPSPSPRSTPRRTPSGPAFTERALLQTSELLEHGWGKAAELSLERGVATKPLLPCVRPDRLPTPPIAAYVATYQGLHTEAAEQVLRLADRDEAEAAVDGFTDEVGRCGTVTSARRVTVGTRHEPDLEGVSEAVWWNVRGTSASDPLRGVLAIARVDDRVTVLYLHATATDPAKTTDVVPLLRQAGLRLV
ncbi:hypothetical protein GCM10022197_00900 [Microlunatus spumicola]|uniref:PknH-like extracellular domain-containing protein n=1 Tax=Microlunatus spumicola TaxID=81499 RepID=A0ABP6WF81_9ACTN